MNDNLARGRSIIATLPRADVGLVFETLSDVINVYAGGGVRFSSGS